MNRSVIFIIVFMVFAYLMAKYKLLPYFAAKKILKDAKKGNTDSGNVNMSDLTQISPLMQAAMMGNYSQFLAQPAPEKPSRRDMYFDYRVITPRNSVESPLDSAVDDMLVALRNRGICPDCFNIVSMGDGVLLAYVTYTL